MVNERQPVAPSRVYVSRQDGNWEEHDIDGGMDLLTYVATHLNINSTDHKFPNKWAVREFLGETSDEFGPVTHEDNISLMERAMARIRVMAARALIAELRKDG